MERQPKIFSWARTRQNIKQYWYAYVALVFLSVLVWADVSFSKVNHLLQTQSTVIGTVFAVVFVFLAYEVIENAIARKEIMQWDRLAGNMLGELRRAANPLHDHIQLFLEQKSPDSFPAKRKGHSKYDKKIRELLPQVLGEIDEYTLTLDQQEQKLVDVIADDLEEFESIFRSWQDMLFRLKMVKIYDLCHDVLVQSRALQRHIDTRCRPTSVSGQTKKGQDDLVKSWDVYTTSRRRLWKEINEIGRAHV